MCSPYLDYQKINPNTQLMIISECIDGCSGSSITSLSFQFKISKEWNIISNDPQKKWLACVDSSSGLQNTSFNFLF